MKSKKNKINLNPQRIIGASIGVIGGLIIIYFIFGGLNIKPANNTQSQVNSSIAPVLNNDDLDKISTQLDNTNLNIIDNELSQIDSESSF